MADQKLSLIVTAIDRATSVIDRINRSVGGLGRGADKATQQTSSLSNAMAFGMVKAQAAIGAATMGYQKLSGAIAQSSALQLENQTAAQTLASLTGQSFDEASGFVDRLNGRLAKSAATLPGVTSEYSSLARTITDNVASAFQDSSGAIKNMQGFEDTLASLSESFGVMSAASNVPVSNTALGLTKLLGGASAAELRQIQFFEQNPVILNDLEKRLNEVGAKSFKDLNMPSRVKLLQEIGEKFVTDEFKQRAGESVDGLLQGFKSSLFDPMDGMFGLMRDLDLEADGVQSAFGVLNNLLKTLLGTNGLAATLGVTLNRMGLTADPMQILSDAFQWLDTQAQRVNRWLQGIQGDLPELSFDNVGEFIADILNAISGTLITAIGGADSGQAATAVGQAFTIVIRELADALAGLSWQSWAVIAAGFIVPPLLGAFATFAGGLVATFLAGTVGIPGILIAGAVLAITAFGAVVWRRWDEITAMASEHFAHIARTFGGGIQLAIGILTGNIGLIHDGMQNLVNGVTGWLNGIRDTWAIITGGETTGEVSANQAAARAEAKYQAALQAKPSFAGYIPNAANGFMGVLSAITRERRAMPTGSGLLVANTSETVLTREQAGAVGGALAQPKGGSTFNITLNVSGTGDPETVADRVLRMLEIKMDEFEQGALV